VGGPIEDFAVCCPDRPRLSIRCQNRGIDGPEDENQSATTKILPQVILQHGRSAVGLDGNSPSGGYRNRAEHTCLSGGFESSRGGSEVLEVEPTDPHTAGLGCGDEVGKVGGTSIDSK